MRVLNLNVDNTDLEMLLSFSSWLLKISSGDIEKVLRGTHDDVEIPNSMYLNSNSAIINFVCDNWENQYLDFEWLSSKAISK